MNIEQAIEELDAKLSQVAEELAYLASACASQALVDQLNSRLRQLERSTSNGQSARQSRTG
jgi:predicted transcriptional regulator